jgi:phage tail sheath protein FI
MAGSFDPHNKAPGVYIQEIMPTGPIAGAGTSTAALIGKATTVANADLGVPFAVTNWTSYTNRFGDYSSALQLPYAVRGFFGNGGTLAYVIAVKDFGGLPGALDQLTRLPDVNLVCAPGLVDANAQQTVLDHCQAMGNRFAILDGAQDADPLKNDGPLQTQRNGLASESGYGALYWPWIVVDDPAATGAGPPLTTVPPSGHIAGIMARTDGQVGVHKAPANETVQGARDLGYTLNDTEQGVLNELSINAIRRFPGGPPLVWGARTLTKNTAWQYVNVRRLVSYVEASILEGIRWAVFEPNTPALWKALGRSITEFLTRVWQVGALFGQTAQQAFYVKIDEELNPEAVRDLGQVVIEIGLAPVRPAEFVVVRIGLWDGGSQVSE